VRILSPVSPLRKFPDLPQPSREMSVFDVPEFAWWAHLFRNKIGFLGRVSVDKIIVPISVDGDASVRDHERSWMDVDKCAA
jgi:hypothetical protein